MKHKQIPRGPWYNPPLADGNYVATIRNVQYTTYGNSGGHVLKIAMWIPSDELFIVTNLYLPKKYARAAHMRLWHLFRSTGVDLQDVENDARDLEGKTLRLQICQNNSNASPVAWSYSDVAAFGPPVHSKVPPVIQANDSPSKYSAPIKLTSGKR